MHLSLTKNSCRQVENGGGVHVPCIKLRGGEFPTFTTRSTIYHGDIPLAELMRMCDNRRQRFDTGLKCKISKINVEVGNFASLHSEGGGTMFLLCAESEY